MGVCEASPFISVAAIPRVGVVVVGDRTARGKIATPTRLTFGPYFDHL